MSNKKTKHQLIISVLEREKAPETHLIKTVAFWASILPPLIVGIALAVIAGISEQRTWDFTSSGYNSFLNDFKLPVGIMGLAIPLGALSAAIHRSIQTSRQIMEQNSQNIFSNYLQHRKHFFDYVDENKPFRELKVDTAVLYEYLFKNAADGDLRPRPVNIEGFRTLLHNVIATIQTEFLPQLNERNLAPKSKNTDEAMASAVKSARLLLGIQLEKPPSAARLSEFRQVFGYCEALKKVAFGLYKSANFHKQYVEAYAFIEIEEGFNTIMTRLAEFRSLVDISESIFQAFKNHGYWAPDEFEEKQINEQGLRRALTDVNNSFAKNKIASSKLVSVFKNQLDDGERKLLREHAPVQWQVILNSLGK